MKRHLWRTVIVLLVLAAVVFLGRNFLGRKLVEAGVQRTTGFPLEMQKLRVQPFSSRIQARDIKLMNPPGFEEQLFASVPELQIDYRLGSVLRGAPHIESMRLNISQIVVVKNAAGESNAARLRGVLVSDDASAKKEDSAKYRVDELRLTIGTVVVRDFSRGRATEQIIPLNIDVTYRNITEATDINRLVLLAVMSKARLPDIGVRPDDLKKALGNITNLAGEIVKDAADVVEKAGKGVLDVIKNIVPQKNKR